MPKSARLLSIDLMRGLVIVLMALDHTRDYFSNALFSPTDLARTNAAYFLTRWITHLCAPTFVFLAGVSAFLYAKLGNRSHQQLSAYLIRRGTLLVVLELTVVRFGWTFNWDMRYGIAQVIWALGWSMITLAGLINLPRRWLTGLSLAVIAGHNLLDGIKPEVFGAADWLWIMLHEPGIVQYGKGYSLYMFYPLVPWFAVMALGYCTGPLFLKRATYRQGIFALIAVAALLLFTALRLTNAYGDPKPWSRQRAIEFTVFSFLNCEKYPPSLLYLLVTLGLMFACLAVFEWRKMQDMGRILLVFGKTPLLFYIAHIYLIHGLAYLLTWSRGLPANWMSNGTVNRPFPEVPAPEFGVSLPAVYGIWLLILVLLYPLCEGYDRYNTKI